MDLVEQRDPPPLPDGTDAEDVGECDLDRLRLLGGVLESADLDLDRLGDRLQMKKKQTRQPLHNNNRAKYSVIAFAYIMNEYPFPDVIKID